MIELKATDRVAFDLHMYQVDYNEQKTEQLKHDISEKYGLPLKNITINFIPITNTGDGQQISLASDIIHNIQDANFQVELFKEYIKCKEIKDIDFDEIVAIDNRVNSYVDFEQYSKFKSYKFKYVKWSNYLSYGADNYFDFTNLHGLVLLNGKPENQCGKTTFAIDLLRFALFGKAVKSPTLDSVFNVYLPEATEVMVEACIEIEGCDYVIRRTVTRPALKKRTEKSKCKQNLEYFKLTNGTLDLIENCEGENTAETNNIIKDCIGNVDDFNLVISATSYTLGDLLRMGNTDKAKLFSRWMGLLSIEKKEEIAKKLWKDTISPSLFSKKYNSSQLEGEITDYNNCITQSEHDIAEANKSVTTLQKEIKEKMDERDKVVTDRRPVRKELEKLDVETINNQIVTKEGELATKRGIMSQHKVEYEKVRNSKFDNDEYDNLLKQIEAEKDKKHELDGLNVELKTKINTLKEDNRRIATLIENKVCPTCNQPIDVSLQNGQIEENNKKIDGYIAEGVSNKNKIQVIDEKIKQLTEKSKAMEASREEVNEKQRLELKMTAVKTNIDNIKLTLQTLKQQLADIEENKESLKYNNEIDLKVNNLNIAINTLTASRDKKQSDIATIQGNIQYYKLEINKRNEIISKIKEEEKLIRDWNLYLEMVGKNGIIKIILRKALPIINNEVARILDGLCDFEVVLDIDDKNNVSIDLVRDGESLDLGTCASGFEGTFASLALRSALASISSISRPNFLCLDEVDSTISSVNYDKLTELYHRILTNYQFIIHIVHNELLADIHDMTITVVKEGNISKIQKIS